MDEPVVEKSTQFHAYIEQVNEAEAKPDVDGYAQISPFDKGYWMAFWYDSKEPKDPIDYFESKYRPARQVAIGTTSYKPRNGLEVSKIKIPVNQVWVR